MRANGVRRIAILIDSLTGGGAEKVMMNLAGTLSAMGHEPHLIAMKKNVAYDLPNTYPIHFLHPTSDTKLKGWFSRSKHAKKLNQLIMLLETKYGEFDGYIANLEETYRIVSKSNLSPCLYVVHNSVNSALSRTKKLGPIKYYYLRHTLGLLSDKHLISVSNGLEQEIANETFIKPKSIKTIYNPFIKEEIGTLAHETNDAIPKEDYIIHVGRAARQKRMDVLFDAFSRVKADIKLVCLCQRVRKAKKLAKKYGVANRVIFPGFQKNPYPWIKNAKAMVLSSDYEGFASVLIESVICGTIPVSTLCPHGPSEIMTGDLAKYLAPIRSPEKLAEKIDLALLDEFQESYCEIVEKIDPEKSAEQYLSALESQAQKCGKNEK
ncbi:MAG: glycosyltransferase involved in cell wall biosynthesis [Lentisphaeria bacterium]|jgi:glycosyltransferase involved in cell wall biosynthesis